MNSVWVIIRWQPNLWTPADREIEAIHRDEASANRACEALNNRETEFEGQGDEVYNWSVEEHRLI